MSRADAAAAERGIQRHPALARPGLVPHVKNEALSGGRVDQSNRHTCRNAASASQTGQQYSVFRAVPLAVPSNLGRRIERLSETLERHEFLHIAFQHNGKL